MNCVSNFYITCIQHNAHPCRIVEKNQTISALALKKEKIGEVIFAESLNDELVPAIEFAVENLEYRRKLTSRSSELVDGKGVSRVVDWLESEL